LAGSPVPGLGLVLLQYRLGGRLAGMYDASKMLHALGEHLASPAYLINRAPA
jgi:hypothetical protein